MRIYYSHKGHHRVNVLTERLSPCVIRRYGLNSGKSHVLAQSPMRFNSTLLFLSLPARHLHHHKRLSYFGFEPDFCRSENGIFYFCYRNVLRVTHSSFLHPSTLKILLVFRASLPASDSNTHYTTFLEPPSYEPC